MLAPEQGVPGVDGRHAMVELVVELAGHDDSVTWELEVQGFRGFGLLIFCDHQNGAATIGKRSDGILRVISLGLVLMEIDAVVFIISV